VPLVTVANSQPRAALARLERWAPSEVGALLAVDDAGRFHARALVDLTRIRVNLHNVPESQRPARESRPRRRSTARARSTSGASRVT
jgi:hypothetical protein